MGGLNKVSARMKEHFVTANALAQSVIKTDPALRPHADSLQPVASEPVINELTRDLTFEAKLFAKLEAEIHPAFVTEESRDMTGSNSCSWSHPWCASPTSCSGPAAGSG